VFGAKAEYLEMRVKKSRNMVGFGFSNRKMRELLSTVIFIATISVRRVKELFLLNSSFHNKVSPLHFSLPSRIA